MHCIGCIYLCGFLFQEPVSVELGSSYHYKRRGAKRLLVERVDTFQYVPLIENLKWMLQNRDLCSEVFTLYVLSPSIDQHFWHKCFHVFQCIQVFKEHPINHTEFLFDFCDGRLYKEHPVFQHDKNALQLVIYFDEVEVANPLGSYHGIHKLGTCIKTSAAGCSIQSVILSTFMFKGMFYYFLGNIDPRLRATLRNIQLIACVTTDNLEKYGYEMILKPFIEDANKLSKVLHIYHKNIAIHLLSGIKACSSGENALASYAVNHKRYSYQIRETVSKQ